CLARCRNRAGLHVCCSGPRTGDWSAPVAGARIPAAAGDKSGERRRGRARVSAVGASAAIWHAYTPSRGIRAALLDWTREQPGGGGRLYNAATGPTGSGGHNLRHPVRGLGVADRPAPEAVSTAVFDA